MNTNIINPEYNGDSPLPTILNLPQVNRHGGE